MSDLDELSLRLKQERLDHAKEVEQIINAGDYLDDGYPTEDALKAIELWDWETNGGSKGWFEFIKGIWAYNNYWWEGECEHKNGEKYYGYAISTAGWSGNESIIYAIE